jgi:hypothetical protein
MPKLEEIRQQFLNKSPLLAEGTGRHAAVALILPHVYHLEK